MKESKRTVMNNRRQEGLDHSGYLDRQATKDWKLGSRNGCEQALSRCLILFVCR